MFNKLILLVIWVGLLGRYTGSPAPKIFSYKIVQTFEHDKSAFTEGLAFRESDGALLESTGLNGKSTISIFDVDEANSVLNKRSSVDFPRNVFGEGIAFYDGNLISLTWLNRKVFIYDRHSLSLKRTIDFDESIGEGWGLTQSIDRKTLIASDGSSIMHKMKIDMETLRISDHIPLHDCHNKMSHVTGINELELVPRFVTHPVNKKHLRDVPPGHFESRRRNEEEVMGNVPTDMIWGNIISTMCVAVVNPLDGNIEAWILLDGLYSDWDRSNKVANGIAFRSYDNTLWVTGKLWTKLFKIELIDHPNPESVDIKTHCTTTWGFRSNINNAPGMKENADPCEKQ